jgi:hypothetical protein
MTLLRNGSAARQVHLSVVHQVQKIVPPSVREIHLYQHARMVTLVILNLYGERYVVQVMIAKPKDGIAQIMVLRMENLDVTNLLGGSVFLPQEHAIMVRRDVHVVLIVVTGLVLLENQPVPLVVASQAQSAIQSQNIVSGPTSSVVLLVMIAIKTGNVLGFVL